VPTEFNSPTTRVNRSGDIPVWDAKLNQWVAGSKKIVTVTSGGATLVKPIIQSGTAAFTAPGGVQFFTITYPIPMTVVNSAVVCAYNPSANIWLNVNSWSATTITAQVLSNGLALLAAGFTFNINWIVVGT